jgi:hypothetical protein
MLAPKAARPVDDACAVKMPCRGTELQAVSDPFKNITGQQNGNAPKRETSQGAIEKPLANVLLS